MKRKSKKRSELEEDWSRVAKLFEDRSGPKLMKSSRALSSIERRKLLGPGKTKLVSLRIPEEDLMALKAIADEHDRKYQQLVVHAIERFLDVYQDIQGEVPVKRRGA